MTQFVLKVQFSDHKTASSLLNHDFGEKIKNAIALFRIFAEDVKNAIAAFRIFTEVFNDCGDVNFL